jgi:hypothetical protein
VDELHRDWLVAPCANVDAARGSLHLSHFLQPLSRVYLVSCNLTMVIEWTAEKTRQLQKEFSWLRARGICGSVNAGVVLCGGFEKLRSSPSKNNQLIAVQGETRPVAHAMFVPRIADRANTEAHFPPRSDCACMHSQKQHHK